MPAPRIIDAIDAMHDPELIHAAIMDMLILADITPAKGNYHTRTGAEEMVHLALEVLDE